MQNLTVQALMDQVREFQNLKSDYQFAKHFGYSTQKVANWRHGRAIPDDKACSDMAIAAGLDPAVVLAHFASQRASEPSIRALWAQIADRLQMAAGVAAAVMLATTFATGFIADNAEAALATSTQAYQTPVLRSLHIV